MVAGISQEDRAMTHGTRALILALFIMLTATVSAYVINVLLTVMVPLYGLPRLSIYAPGASVITNLITSALISDSAAQARFAASREFMLIQTAIFLCLVMLSSLFAFSTRNPKGIFTVITCSLLVVVPGIAILKAWAPAYFSHRAPDVRWGFFDFQTTVLQMGLSLPFYAALFFVGSLILTEGQPRKTGAL